VARLPIVLSLAQVEWQRISASDTGFHKEREVSMQSSTIFNATDLEQISARGMTVEGLLAQLARLEQGFPFLPLQRPCTVHDGIDLIEEADVQTLTAVYTQAAGDGRVMSFVPASGAASRMFKPLLSFLNRYERIDRELVLTTVANDDADGRDLQQFADGINHFAFYRNLGHVLSQHSLDLQVLLKHGQYRIILEHLLTSKGLDYANLPKGALPFHRYIDHQRTPFHEHIVESSLFTRSYKHMTKIHFTVSKQHYNMILDHINTIISSQKQDKSIFDISLSTQNLSSDVIAVDLEDRPFLTNEGSLLFRPGGHGALIENLNSVEGDIIFLKNIDNVVPDHLKGETCRWRIMLGGYLVVLQNQVFDYLRKLSTSEGDARLIGEIFAFARQRLSLMPPAVIKHAALHEQADYLREKLNRPLRVCGMVKNIGEAGGGPFWVEHPDGSQSLQIVETTQVDLTSAAQRAIIASSTHFNPVDLVCGVRDYRGKPFDLHHFVDPETGFITLKSHDGRDLKALEWPGLWNGSMAHWNTIFVEVPRITFNPVKTVLDLLRQEHQPE